MIFQQNNHFHQFVNHSDHTTSRSSDDEIFFQTVCSIVTLVMPSLLDCSIMMTALSAILAFGAMPLNLWLYATRTWTSSESLVVPYINILVSLLFLTIPVLVGMIIRHFTRRWANYISKVSFQCYHQDT